MQTNFSSEFLATSEGQEVDAILRSCVHCGFCTATCPTFLLTGNELDSPRGRIYLIKEMLEGGPCSEVTQTHLDRCLTCQSCETTCPSNVQYHRLLDVGRKHIEDKVGRSLWMSGKRFMMRKAFTSPVFFKTMLGLGRLFRVLLPAQMTKTIPDKVALGVPPTLTSARKMILLNGCVQQSLSPQTNAASARVLAKLNIQTISLSKEGCCGGLSYHLNAQTEGLDQARRNIDLFYSHLEDGVEAIISTASGCGNFIKDYALLLKDDAEYAAKARKVSDCCLDISDVLQKEDLSSLAQTASSQTLAVHCPCSLQHGQQNAGKVEAILGGLGYDLSYVPDSHLCCGSAGTYSLLQPKLSKQLQTNKINALMSNKPDVIVTANVGCQNHLAAVSDKPVKHWIETIDEGLRQ